MKSKFTVKCTHAHTFPADKMFPKDFTAGYNGQVDPFYSENLFMFDKKHMKKTHTRRSRRYNKKQCLLSTIG